MSETSNQVEALLFSSGRAMDVDDIAAITDIEKKKVKKALQELKKDYDSRDTSLMLIQEGNQWKLNIKEKYISLVTKIIADTELSRATMQTLSIIAWKAPALQSEIIKIRTSQAYEHIKELVDLGFIIKEKAGRSYKIRLAEKFFEYFDVHDDKAIKAVFKEVKQPEEIQKLGDLEVVSTDNNSHEHGKTAEIFGTKEGEEIQKSEVTQEEKEDIVVDKEFLEKINSQIDEIARKNDELDEDELFKKSEVEEESDESEQGDSEKSEDKEFIESETERSSEDLEEKKDSEQDSEENLDNEDSQGEEETKEDVFS